MLRPDQVRAEINRLKVEYPELEDDADLFLDTLEGETDFLEVLRFLVDQEQEAKALALAVKERIDTLADRRARFNNRSEAMRSMIHRLLQDSNQRKVELPEATISLRMVPPKVIVLAEDELPDDCVKIRREADKKAIKARIEKEGGCTGATLTNGYETISIRYT